MRQLYYIPPPKLRRIYRRRRERINGIMAVLVMMPMVVMVWVLMFL